MSELYRAEQSDVQQALSHIFDYSLSEKDALACDCAKFNYEKLVYYQDRIKCPVNMNESEVEMVISTVLKPLFVLCFGRFILSW